MLLGNGKKQCRFKMQLSLMWNQLEGISLMRFLPSLDQDWASLLGANNPVDKTVKIKK